ncbi:unnamed protein product [Arabidopsis lyrata]|uniref:Transcriptional factor B3 family protein n=1 Tax=Arabidopsis lyrata subsp. lyrata TaxID=81972 RepID=D7LIB5_ARALL|nr:transcriptional factor B3 family protein [Arabidopsis lyrata subsp. lyrata]CAH8263405.1 unnamed protein product [Arabidopsis lyrata]
MMIQVSDHHDNNIEFQRQKNSSETEADYSCFVTASSQQTDALRLPMQFTRENGINKPGKIYLLGKDGSKWLANLLSENNRGRMTLGDGWKSFVKANGLKTGDTYTFKLFWDDTIPVLSLCSEEYNTDTRVGEECSKESLPTEPSSQEKVVKDDNNKHESNKDESSLWKREDNHLRCIDSTSPSENRSLTLTITPDSLEHGRLRLPLQFMTENNMNKPGEITLLGKDGAKWMASLLLERRGRMSLGKGWKDFAKANGVKTGDSITLESIWEDTTPVLKLISIESSSGQFSKESLSVEPSSGNMTEKAEKNREASRKYPPRSRESSSAIENQFMALTPSCDIISQVAHDLRIGEVIIFRHEGDNMLQVSDLGPNCCGILDVPAPSSNNDHDNIEHPSKKKVKKNNPETEADYLSDHSCSVAHVTTSSLHANALSLAVKESITIEPSIDDNNKDESSKEENDIEEKSNNKNNIEESSSFEREKNHRICIDSISSSHNRFLTLTITPDSLKHGRLRLPLQFMTENSMNKPGEITVLGKDGAKWLVSLLLERRGRMSLDASSGHKTREAEKNRDSSSEIENRFLTLTLAPEDVKDGNLHLPIQFMRINGINKPGKITLLGRGGLKWFAYLLSRDGTVVLGNGWKGFCEANGVMLGESFILEFISIEDTNHVFKFYSSYGDQIDKC